MNLIEPFVSPACGNEVATYSFSRDGIPAVIVARLHCKVISNDRESDLVSKVPVRNEDMVNEGLVGRKVFVAGHKGMVGSAIVRRLAKLDCEVIVRTRTELDLLNQQAVSDFFVDFTPDVVFFAAARVGGIHANNSYPAEFAYENLVMATNAIHAAYKSGVNRFLFLGSTCIYPKFSPQPIAEDSLLTGPLEATNEAYAIAKIAGLKMCEYYRRQYGVNFHSAMPTNLYGPGDNYHPSNSHVLPALLSRIHRAKENGESEVVIWGTGSPRREFLFVDCLADACLHLVSLSDPPSLVNVGTGVDISIKDLAHLLAEVVGYEGDFVFDTSKPDGTPVKRSDTRKLNALGWSPRVSLREGVALTYQSFLDSEKSLTLRSV